MIHIVLLVLKIIGIILASVLGLLIALLLIVLFAPIRYKLKAEYEEAFEASAKITWLLRIISFTAEYGNDSVAASESETSYEETDGSTNFRMRLKIFGRIIFDSSKVKEDSEEKKGLFAGRGKKRRKSKEQAQENKVSVLTAEPASVDSKKVQVEEKSVTNERTETARIAKSEAEAVPGLEEGSNSTTIEQQVKTEIQVKSEVIGELDISKATESSTKAEEPIEKKKGLFHFIRKAGDSIRNFWGKMKAFVSNLKEKIEGLTSNVSKLYSKYQLIRLFFQDDKNKLGFQYGFRSIKGILRHVRPKKVQAYIEFGTGDPCSTGQILGVAAAFMGLYKNSVQIIPDFEEEVIKGNFYCRGRIQTFIFLIIGVKLILNRDIKNLIKNFQTLKEEF
ncbi:DUF2953 domain-containing protein [Anaerocolumna chitinilytica]|uniref:DUF2953 domain-containing protein n=1 Tax=Anaerocolumna chitinilytica TaxID=1727145 RepID=A0A7I8DPG8_9FIRM|nr:DUF2953 domain-containing protein [Anaerocolumna chitinilytica]BCK00311.1 hypothetical protein bsdcttw_33510 [Anaerocolumna chitinilytica]